MTGGTSRPTMRRGVLALALASLVAGCASIQTQKAQHAGATEKLSACDYACLIAQIQAAKDKYYKPKDKVLYYLDLGLLHHLNGQPRESNAALVLADDAIREAYTRSISKAATSFMLNDNALDYAGEDYEDIYLNIIKAVNYIAVGDPDAGFVEIRRVNEKLVRLEDRHVKLAEQLNRAPERRMDFKAGKNRFHNSALARYLGALLYRREGQFDDARIDVQKIRDVWRISAEQYNFPPPPLDHLAAPAPGPRLHVVAFTGRAPEKMAKTLWIHTFSNEVWIGQSQELPKGRQSALNIYPWPGMPGGIHLKLALPYLYRHPSPVVALRVTVNDQATAYLDLIENMENVAIETFKAKEPLIYLKTLTRIALKIVIAETSVRELSKDKDEFTKLMIRTSTYAALGALEGADLRAARYLPGRAWVGELPLAAGRHKLKIEYLDAGGRVLRQVERDQVAVDPAGLNLLHDAWLN